MNGSISHLTRRCFWSIRAARPLDPDERELVSSLLGQELHGLFARMTDQDQRHSFEVMQAVRLAYPHAPTSIVQAALMHDVGKSAAPLGTLGRVAATLLAPIIRRREPVAVGEGSVADGGSEAATGLMANLRIYVHYERIGAQLIRFAAPEADSVVADWAEQHHEHERSWTIPIEWGWALADADRGGVG